MSMSQNMIVNNVRSNQQSDMFEDTFVSDGKFMKQMRKSLPNIFKFN